MNKQKQKLIDATPRTAKVACTVWSGDNSEIISENYLSLFDPWVTRWEQSIHRSLFLESEKRDYFVKFNVDGLLRGDYQSRMNGYAVRIQNGFMSPNDIRSLENMDLISDKLGGNLYLMNGTMTKLQDTGAFAQEVPGKKMKWR